MVDKKRVVKVDLIGDATSLLKAFNQVRTQAGKGLKELDNAVKGLFKGGNTKPFVDSFNFKDVLTQLRNVKSRIAELNQGTTSQRSTGKQLAADLAKVEPQINKLIASFSRTGKAGSNAAAENNAGFIKALKTLTAMETQINKLSGKRKLSLEFADKTIVSTLNQTKTASEKINIEARRMVDNFVRTKQPVVNYAQAVRQVAATLTEASTKSKEFGKVTQTAVNLALAKRNAELRVVQSQITLQKELLAATIKTSASRGVSGAVRDVVQGSSKPVGLQEELELSKRIARSNREGVLTRKQLTAVGQQHLKAIRLESSLLAKQVSLQRQIKVEAQAAAAVEKTGTKTQRIQEEQQLLTTVRALAAGQDNLGVSSRQLESIIKKTTQSLIREGVSLDEAKKKAQARLSANTALIASYNAVAVAAKRSEEQQRAQLTAQIFQAAPAGRGKEGLEVAKQAAALAVKEGKSLAQAVTLARQLASIRAQDARTSSTAVLNQTITNNRAVRRSIAILTQSRAVKRSDLSATIDLNRAIRETAEATVTQNLTQKQSLTLLRSTIALKEQQASSELKVAQASRAAQTVDKTKQIQQEQQLVTELIRHARANNNLGVTEKVLKTAIERTARSLIQENTNLKAGSRAAIDRLNANIKLARSYGVLNTNQENVRVSGLGSLGVLALVDRSLSRIVNTVRRSAAIFAEFEVALTEVRKTANASTEDMQALSVEIVKLGQETKVPVKDLATIAGVLGQVGQLPGGGIDQAATFATNASEAIKLVGQVALATDLAAEDAAKSFGQLSSIFVDDVDDIIQSLSGMKGGVVNATDALRVMFGVMNELSNSSVATVKDLNRFIENFGGVASQSGLTQAQVAALGATIRDLGITSKVAGTALSRIFNDMTKRSEVFADAIGVTKSSFDALFLTDPNQALLDFLNALGTASKARVLDIKNQLSLEQRASNTLLKLAGNTQLYEKHLVTAGDAMSAFVSVQNEADKFAQTFQASLQGVANSFTGLLNSMRPIFAIASALGDSLAFVISGLSGFLEANQGIATLASAILALGLIVVTTGGFIAVMVATIKFIQPGQAIIALNGWFSKLGLSAAAASLGIKAAGTAATTTSAQMGALSAATEVDTVVTGANTAAHGANATALNAQAVAAATAGRAMAALAVKATVAVGILGTLGALITGNFAAAGGFGLLTASFAKSSGVTGLFSKAMGLLVLKITAVAAIAAVAAANIFGAFSAAGESAENIGDRAGAGVSTFGDSIITTNLHVLDFFNTINSFATGGLFTPFAEAADQLERINDATNKALRIHAGAAAKLNAQTAAIKRNAEALGETAATVQKLLQAIEAQNTSAEIVEGAILSQQRGLNEDAIGELLERIGDKSQRAIEEFSNNVQIIGERPTTEEDEKNLEDYLKRLAPTWQKALATFYESSQKISSKQAFEKVSDLGIEELIRELNKIPPDKRTVEVLVALNTDDGLQVDADALSEVVTEAFISPKIKAAIKSFDTINNNLSTIKLSLEEIATVSKVNVIGFDFSPIEEGERRLESIAKALDILNGFTDGPEGDTAVNVAEAELKSIQKSIKETRERRLNPAADQAKLARDLEVLFGLEDDSEKKLGELKVARAKQVSDEKLKLHKLRLENEAVETKKFLDAELAEAKRGIEAADFAIKIKEFEVEEGSGTEAELSDLKITKKQLEVNAKAKKRLNEIDLQIQTAGENINFELLKQLTTEEKILKERRNLLVVKLEEQKIREAGKKIIEAESKLLKEESDRIQEAKDNVNERADAEKAALGIIIKGTEEVIALEQRRRSLDREILEIQRETASSSFGEGITNFSKAITSATDKSAALVRQVLELRQGESSLDGIAAAYENIAQSARRAAFEAGKFTDDRRALEESLARDPSSEKARAAELLFAKVREIQASGQSEETIFANIGATISLFERRAGSLKGIGPSVSEIAKAAEQLAFSEEGRLATSRQLASEFQKEFTTTRAGYKDQQDRLEEIEKLRARIAGNERAGGRSNARRNQVLQERLDVRIKELRVDASKLTGTEQEIRARTVNTAASERLAEVTAGTAASMKVFSDGLNFLGETLKSLDGLDLSTLAAGGFPLGVQALKDQINFSLAQSADITEVATAAATAAQDKFTTSAELLVTNVTGRLDRLTKQMDTYNKAVVKVGE